MNKTNDFKYNLPGYSDPVDIEDLNDNFRGIDDALMAGLCKKDYTGNNMGSSDPSARKYAWAPWFEIVNDNEFDVVVTDRNAPVESEEATINIAAGQTFRKYINGRYYMNFYVQDQHDVTFKWFTNAETYINESGGGGGGTGTVTSVSVQGGSGSHLTGSGNPIETSGTITINIDEGYSIPSDNEQTAWDGKAADLKAEIDSSTYVLTLQLKDSAGNLIGTAKTIDLPLETMVVDGEYDPQTQKIKLELKNGNYVEFSVADLVSGLQTELSASNKLNPEYIAYDASHRAVSDTEKDTWDAKQNALTFDDTPTQNSNNPVKSGGIYTALAGKQASLDSTQLAAVNSGIDSSKVGQISTNQTNILSVLNRTGKNIINIQAPTSTRGCAFTTGNNGAVTITNTENWSQFVIENVHVKTNTQYKLVFYTDAISNLPAFNVYLRDHDKEGSALVEGFTVSNTGTIVKDFTSISDVLSLNIYPNNQATTVSGTATIRVMICEKTLYDLSSEYTWGVPNYDLTRLESEDRAGLVECVDGGAKNIIDVNNYSNLDNVTISNGVFTTQGDTLTTLRFDVYLRNGSTTLLKVVSAQSISSNGVYYWEFVAPANTNNVLIGHNGGTYNGRATINLTNLVAGQRYVIQVNVTQCQNSSGAFKWQDVMICTKAAFCVSKAFVPYRGDYTPTAFVKKKLYTVSTANTYETIADLSTLLPTGKICKITATAYYTDSAPTGVVLYYGNTITGNKTLDKREVSETISAITVSTVINSSVLSNNPINLAVRYNATGNNSVWMCVEVVD